MLTRRSASSEIAPTGALRLTADQREVPEMDSEAALESLGALAVFLHIPASRPLIGHGLNGLREKM
ncbi:MAG: hypothetical protein JWO36_1764 [Myxococcales bacterium]|nr:hypothetical protein [Myxococcales bacterium]